MNEIKQARTEAGLTQKEVAELLNIPQKSYENWEQGRYKPPVYTKNLIIEKLHQIAKKKAGK